MRNSSIRTETDCGPSGEPYQADLAYVHDTGFGDFARQAAPGLLARIGQSGAPSQLIVDLGCGSGIWARAAADAGYRVIGVDLSAEMIELARRRVPEATFHVGSFADFAIPPCHCVTALGEVFNYLFDPAQGWPTLERACRNIFASLIAGGVLIFDVAEPGRSSGLTRSFREGDDWACLVEYLHDEASRQLTRRIVTFRRIGELYRRHEELHRQQLYERAAVADMLRSLGFGVEVLSSYGAAPFPPGLVGFVARKE
jgi:SAM-dependent methyltransferase